MAADFDGTDDYIDCGSGATLDDLSPISVVAWINPDAVTQDNGIAGKGNPFANPAAGGTGWAFYLTTAPNLVWAIGYSTLYGQYNTSYTPSVGTWGHVAVTYTRGGTPVLYVNGISLSVTTEQATSGSANTDAAQSLFLADELFGTADFDGRLEDIRVFNRTLTGEEIALLAAGYRGPLGGEVGWWSCDNFRGVAHPDGATLTAATHYLRDESGNGNTGDPIGGVIARASDAPRFGPTG